MYYMLKKFNKFIKIMTLQMKIRRSANAANTQFKVLSQYRKVTDLKPS